MHTITRMGRMESILEEGHYEVVRLGVGRVDKGRLLYRSMAGYSIDLFLALRVAGYKSCTRY